MTVYFDRREVLAGMAAMTGLVIAGEAVAGTAQSLSFLVVGDWGRDGSSHQKDVANAMDRAAAEKGSQFTMSVGDNFYDTGVKSVTDHQWKTSFEDIYTGAHLQTPWHVALGNHDYGGSPQAQIDYSKLSPRWNMPSRYFKVAGDSLGFSNLDLFVIDTTPLVNEYAGRTDVVGTNVRRQDTAAQLAWLDSELGASTARWKLVFGHHTLFSGGSTHGDTPEMIERVLPILQKHKVTAFINGHDHDLQHIRRSGLDFVCTGAGSQVRPVKAIEGTQFCEAVSGFSVFTVTPAALSFEFRNFEGKTIYASTIASDLPQAA